MQSNNGPSGTPSNECKENEDIAGCLRKVGTSSRFWIYMRTILHMRPGRDDSVRVFSRWTLNAERSTAAAAAASSSSPPLLSGAPGSHSGPALSLSGRPTAPPNDEWSPPRSHRTSTPVFDHKGQPYPCPRFYAPSRNHIVYMDTDRTCTGYWVFKAFAFL